MTQMQETKVAERPSAETRQQVTKMKKEVSQLGLLVAEKNQQIQNLQKQHRDNQRRAKARAHVLDQLKAAKLEWELDKYQLEQKIQTLEDQIRNLKTTVMRKNNEIRVLKETTKDCSAPVPAKTQQQKKQNEMRTKKEPQSVMSLTPSCSLEALSTVNESEDKDKDCRAEQPRAKPPMPTKTQQTKKKQNEMHTKQESPSVAPSCSLEALSAVNETEDNDMERKWNVLLNVARFTLKLRRRRLDRQRQVEHRNSTRRASSRALYVREVTLDTIKTDSHGEVNASAEKSSGTRDMLAEALTKIALFGPISRASRQRAADMMFSVSYLAGQTILTEGDAGKHLYVIETGAVEVFAHGKRVSAARSIVR